jgi:hypothetical protein
MQDRPQSQSETREDEQVRRNYDPELQSPPQKGKYRGPEKAKQTATQDKHPGPGKSPPIMTGYRGASASGREQINFEGQIAEGQN